MLAVLQKSADLESCSQLKVLTFFLLQKEGSSEAFKKGVSLVSGP